MDAANCWCCYTAEVSRELGQTLRAALSTLFLVIAANWQLSILSGIGESPGWFGAIRAAVLRTAFAVMLSFFTLTLSIMDLFSVLSLWLQPREWKDRWKAGLIGTCPILIPVPPEHGFCQQQLEGLAHSTGETVAKRLGEYLFPLALSASPTGKDAARPESDQQITAFHAWKEEVPVEASKKQPYIVLSPLFLGKHGRRAREELLKMKLLPEYQDLRILRSRSKFQNGITVVQVAWYMAGVAVRLAEGRMNSPLEVIVGHLSIQVLLQLVIATIACSHYHRPLLLRLSPMQFDKFINCLKSRSDDTRTSTHWVKRCCMAGGLVFTLFLLPVPLLCYALRVRRSCFLCFCSTLLMTLLPLLSFLILGMVTLHQYIEYTKAYNKLPTPPVMEEWPPNSLGLPWFQEKFVRPLLSCLLLIVLLYLLSVGLGGVVTYLYWKKFNLGTSDIWHDCILPHISLT